MLTLLAMLLSAEPVLTGPMDPSQISRVVAAHRGEVKGCYERELKRAPDLRGKVTVHFEIQATGKVAAVSVSSNTTGSEPLGTCTSEQVVKWVFPKPRGGGIVIVNYPFTFDSSLR
jgi:TonB family protein